MVLKFSKGTLFTHDLNGEVEKYFLENKLSKKGAFALYFKTIFWISIVIYSYIILVFYTPQNILSAISLCLLLGIAFACIGFNIMHDASHGSYSKNSTVNRIFAYSLNLLGANTYIWDKKHNMKHHTSPNVEGYDDDIHVSPILRMSNVQPWYWWHKLQILYMWPLYSIEYIGWIWIFDLKKYFTGKVCDTPLEFTRREHWVFWGTKIVYVIIFIALPMFFVGIKLTLIGYGITAGVCGIIISIVFQLAHVQEKSSFPTPISTNKEGVEKIEKENAIHQLETTANFAPNNKIISWLVGGLNYQVEHHLFPNISHIHYPKIRPIVKGVCEKHGVIYNEYRTGIGAFISHIKHMWQMSKNPNFVP